MKRNIIRDMTAPKGTKKTWAQRWDLVPRVLCLLLALLLWLVVEDVSSHSKADADAGNKNAQVETIE